MLKRVRLSLGLLCLAPAALAAPSDAPPQRPRPQVAGRVTTSASDPAALCEAAAAAAELTERLPPRLLQAIGLTESGRIDPASGRVRPWPWTIDVEGEGQFFATRQEAVAAVREAQARGVRSIDVGCNQVNLMYHPTAFASLEDAFDPTLNARFAGRFLNALYIGSRDWSRAIAAYHSETPALGAAYRVLVLARWQNPNLKSPVGAVTEAESPYQAFAPTAQVYGAFQPATRVYGAFSQPR